MEPMDWTKAEARFPGCSAQWDVQDGNDWVSKHKAVNIKFHVVFGVLIMDLLNHGLSIAYAWWNPGQGMEWGFTDRQCDKECGTVMHMTGGRHRTDCAAHESRHRYGIQKQ